MTQERLSLGRTGEQMAVDYLGTLGYRIIECNYRCPVGEIDIVAEEHGTLVFIEVKTRRGMEFGHPLEIVGRRKQRKIARSAQHYLAVHESPERACRFDAVAIVMNDTGVNIELVRSAFELEE